MLEETNFYVGYIQQFDKSMIYSVIKQDYKLDNLWSWFTH